jgi:hypothetical protein
MNCTTVSFFKIPIHAGDASDAAYHLFDILLPSVFNEHTNLMILSILCKLRSALYHQKNIDAILSDFLDSQPYVTFNHIYMPDVEEKPRVSTESLKYIFFGDRKFSLNAQENSDFYFNSMVCMAMMNKYK